MLSCHDLETTCLFSCCNTRVPVHCTDKVTRIQTVVSVEETVGEARVYRSGASPAKSAIAIDTKAQSARGGGAVHDVVPPQKLTASSIGEAPASSRGSFPDDDGPED